MFRWFEQRLDPYPTDPPQMPPRSLAGFVLHYSRGTIGWLAALGVLSGLIAAAEVALFGYLGELVNRLADSDPATEEAETRHKARAPMKAAEDAWRFET